MRLALIPATLILAWSAGCRLSTAPSITSPALSVEQPLPGSGQAARRVGVILFYQEPLVVEVPASATVGHPLPIVVTTYGGGCIGEDTLVVQVAALQADVVPFQRHYNPGPAGACTQELRVNRRQAAVTFTSPGRATVRVIGRASPGDSLVQVQRTVDVR